jgi:hypothetical protein
MGLREPALSLTAGVKLRSAFYFGRSPSLARKYSLGSQMPVRILAGKIDIFAMEDLGLLRTQAQRKRQPRTTLLFVRQLLLLLR